MVPTKSCKSSHCSAVYMFSFSVHLFIDDLHSMSMKLDRSSFRCRPTLGIEIEIDDQNADVAQLIRDLRQLRPLSKGLPNTSLTCQPQKQLLVLVHVYVYPYPSIAGRPGGPVPSVDAGGDRVYLCLLKNFLNLQQLLELECESDTWMPIPSSILLGMMKDAGMAVLQLHVRLGTDTDFAVPALQSFFAPLEKSVLAC